MKHPSSALFNGLLYLAIGLVLLIPLVVVSYPIFGGMMGNAAEVIFVILIGTTIGLLVLIRGAKKS
ncbi:hypothetical protein [Rhodococcus sp. IEGM 1379]|uniref:hypothetical protein n=1 Tax=Rhodococcus sp. IEGM 1379 TaxID=3047086 RepID=UPI0024B69FD3|nr:hypothetical protein [Rhodococcus sp. IEGM 1379]MDI9916470.1 hypothetical protein [Rhodococcus sp. IEGM 1379]